MAAQITRETDGTIKLTITIPAADAEKTRTEVVGELVKHVEVAGFRRGTAPRKIAEAKLSQETIREEVLKKVVTKAYNEALKEHTIQPIITPSVHIETFTEGTDIVFTAETCEEPKIELGNYQVEVAKITAKSKIIIPGKDNEKPNIDEILAAILKTAKLTIPNILIEQEVNRLLGQMLDELKSLGMNLESYLSSRGKTAEQMREEYKSKAENDLKLEFILRKIADEQKITVEQKDIEQALSTIKDPKQKEQIAQNPYFLASVIRQQKTLDFLSKI